MPFPDFTLPAPTIDESGAGLHVRYQYIVRGTSNPGLSLSCGVTRPDGLRYDFHDGTFNAAPTTPTAALATTDDVYRLTISPTPTKDGNNQPLWYDGEYLVRVYSGLEVVRTLGAILASGDDGHEAEPRPIGTTPDMIGRDVLRYLVDLQLVASQNLYVAESRDQFPVGGYPMIVAYPSDVNSTAGDGDGAGREFTPVSGGFNLAFVDRSLTDQGNRDDQRATSFLSGVQRKAHAVVDALQHYWPVDAAGNSLTVEPLRCRIIASPRSAGPGGPKAVDAKRVDVAITYTAFLKFTGMTAS